MITKASQQKKKYHHNLRWLLCCCWCPPPPPINCIRSNRHLFINPVGCCVCFPVIRAAMIARDEWIHCLFFVELSIPLGWLLCCYRHSSPPHFPARIPIDCCVVCVVFVGLHGPCLSDRRWIARPCHRSLVHSLVRGLERWLHQRWRYNRWLQHRVRSSTHPTWWWWCLVLVGWRMVAAAMVSIGGGSGNSQALGTKLRRSS